MCNKFKYTFLVKGTVVKIFKLSEMLALTRVGARETSRSAFLCQRKHLHGCTFFKISIFSELLAY